MKERAEYLLKLLINQLMLHLSRDLLCEENGCWNRDTLPCRLSRFRDDEKDLINYFCTTHATKHGYCWSCGEFWAGVEAFDFDQMDLCPNCKDEYMDEMDEVFDDAYDPYLDGLPSDLMA